jgi:hypothetical protein
MKVPTIPNTVTFTVRTLGRKPLAEVTLVFPVGRRALGKVVVERRVRSALGGRLSRAPAPATPLKVVAIVTGPAGTFNEVAADQVLVPVSENHARHVVLGPTCGDHRRQRIETRYRLSGRNMEVSPRWDPSSTLAESLVTWLAAA